MAVPPYQERLKILEGRCSPFAAELLRDLQDDCDLPLLVAALERMTGSIYRSDIEAAFMEIRTRRKALDAD